MGLARAVLLYTYSLLQNRVFNYERYTRHS